MSEGENQQRRAGDARVDRLVEDVAALKQGQVTLKTALDQNTEITSQVHDLLASFRVAAQIAKWVTVIASMAAAMLAAAKGFIHFNDINDITPK